MEIYFYYLYRNDLAKIMPTCCCPPDMELDMKLENYTPFLSLIKEN